MNDNTENLNTPSDTEELQAETEAPHVTAEGNGLPPVDAETLQRLEEAKGRRLQIADQLLSLEQQKIALMRAAVQVDGYVQSLFTKINQERKLNPRTPIEIDPATGTITVLQHQAQGMV